MNRIQSQIQTYQFGGFDWKEQYGNHRTMIGRIGNINISYATNEGWKAVVLGLALKPRWKSLDEARTEAIAFAKRELHLTLGLFPGDAP